MKKKVFAPFGVVIDIPAKIIKLIELLRDGIAVDTKRLTGKDMNQIGLCYWYGHIVPLDYEKAVKWYMASAEKRYCGAEHNLFICYRGGTGVAISMEAAFYWLKRAAKHHDAAAQNFLGEYYYEGKLVKRNRRYAKIWFSKSMTNAFKNVDSVTLNDLGAKYYKGEYGFPKDRNMAIKCFEKAAEEKLYLSIAWLITIYIDDYNREKADFWMKEYYKCLKRNRGLSVMIKSKYERFIESLEGRYHDEKT